jgi:hypothetical protein
MRDVAIGSLLPTRTGTAILRGLHKRAHYNGHQPVTCRTQSIKDAMVGNMINPSIKATKPEVPMRKLVQARSETLKRFIQTNSRNSAASLSQLREYFEVRFRLSVPILTGRCQLSLQLLSTDFQ